MASNAPINGRLTYHRPMKWIIGCILVATAVVGAYLWSQPRLDAICVARMGYHKMTRSHADWSCLHYAARRGDTRAIRASLDDDAPIDQRTADQRTALMLAAEGGHLRALQLLLRHRPELAAADARHGWTALHWAVEKQHPALVRALVGAGASVDPLDKQDRTPFLLSAQQKQSQDTQIAHTLVARGADPKRADNAGNTALLYAAREGNIALVRYLIALGVPIDQRNQLEMTPLFSAITHDQTAVVRALLAAGASPVARVSGVAPLARALQDGDTDIAQLLRANGADNYRLYAMNAALEQGDRAFMSQKYAEAVAAYSDAVQLAPDQAAPYAARAEALQAQTQRLSAQQDMQRAIMLAPGNADYPLRLAHWQIDAGQPDEATRTLRAALSRVSNPDTLQRLLNTLKPRAAASTQNDSSS